MSENGEITNPSDARLLAVSIFSEFTMNYRIVGLDPLIFRSLFQLDDEELRERRIDRSFATSSTGMPCRVSLEDACEGDEVLLLNYAHLTADTPYASIGPIFVRRKAVECNDLISFVNRVPPVLRRRLLSIRAYDGAAYMTDAEVCEGRELDGQIRRFFADSNVAYLHVHNARRGCFAARVERD